MYSQEENQLPESLPDVSRRDVLKGLLSLAVTPLPKLDSIIPAPLNGGNILAGINVHSVSPSSFAAAVWRLKMYTLEHFDRQSHRFQLSIYDKLIDVPLEQKEHDFIMRLCMEARVRTAIDFENNSGRGVTYRQYNPDLKLDQESFEHFCVQYHEMDIQKEYYKHPSLTAFRERAVGSVKEIISLTDLSTDNSLFPERTPHDPPMKLEDLKLHIRTQLEQELKSLKRPIAEQLKEKGFEWNLYSGRQQFSIIEHLHNFIDDIQERIDKIDSVNIGILKEENV